VTGIRSNMKNKLIPLFDEILPRKRSVTETVNDQLKASHRLSTRVIAAPSTFWSN